MRNGKLRKVRIFFLIPLALIFIPLVFNAGAFLILRSEPVALAPFSGPGIYDPYRNAVQKWQKVAFHLHTYEVFFTPERPSPEEVFHVYGERGYDIVIITDYSLVTDISRLSGFKLPAFEWGANIRKRHMIIVGDAKPIRDPFPFFWDCKNLQWVVSHFEKNNAFVVLAHPKLWGGLSADTVNRMTGYDAVEVVYPTGPSFNTMELLGAARSYQGLGKLVHTAGDLEMFDRLLDSGHYVHAISSADLHYFPPFLTSYHSQSFLKKLYHRLMTSMGIIGEPFTHYMLINTDKRGESILRALKEGRFVSVKQILSGPAPEIKTLGIRDGNVEIEFGSVASYIGFVGDGGRLIRSFERVSKASVPFPEGDHYVRIEAFVNSSVVLTNAFRRGTPDPN